jgi:hypothetical protein
VGDATLEAAEARAYRDGRVDAKIEQHEERLDAINGSIAKTADHLAELVASVGGLHRDFLIADTERKAVQPLIEQLLAERTTALKVAEIASSRWDGWRGRAVFVAGAATVAVAVSNFVFLHL